MIRVEVFIILVLNMSKYSADEKEVNNIAKTHEENRNCNFLMRTKLEPKEKDPICPQCALFLVIRRRTISGK